MLENRVVGEGNPYVLLELLKEAVAEDSDVLLDSYCDVWLELCGFLQKFGTIFGFATNDVTSKLDSLRSYAASNKDKYRSIKSMFEYESAEGIIHRETPRSGVSFLLTLHRAQIFLISLITRIAESPDDQNMRTLASQVYDETLAKHHGWFVTKVAHAAMILLPNKKSFLETMRGPMPPEEDEHFHRKFNEDANLMVNRIGNLFDVQNIGV